MSFSHEDRLPSLNALRAFAVTGRHLSFSRAAEELYVEQGAVSGLVKQLEADTVSELFLRGPCGLELTGDGAAYLSAQNGVASCCARLGEDRIVSGCVCLFKKKSKM